MGKARLNVLAGKLGYFVVGSAMLLIWAASFWLVSHSRFCGEKPTLSDLATLLFGATSIALFIFSMLVAFVAIFGWRNLQEEIRDKVRAETAERIKDLEAKRITPLEAEVKGRVLTALGFLMGELSINPKSLKVVDPDRLAEAIRLCRQAYGVLRQIEGQSPAEYMSLNNLVFYSCLSGDMLKSTLLTHARDLMKVGHQRGSTALLITACRAVLSYGEEPRDRQEALETLDLLKKQGLTERETKEVERLLGLYLSRMEKPSGTKTP